MFNHGKQTVDTISVPRFDPVIIPTPSGSIEETEKNETQQKVENANEKKAVVDPEEDKVLRLRLTRLNDDGYQTFGLMEVLDNNMEIYYMLYQQLNYLGMITKMEIVAYL